MVSKREHVKARDGITSLCCQIVVASDNRDYVIRMASEERPSELPNKLRPIVRWGFNIVRRLFCRG